MAKVRVYELAREIGRDNKSLEEVIRGLGITIKNYMSTLTPDEAERVRAAVQGSAPGGGPAPNKRSAKTVIRRRGAEVKRRRAERAEAEEAAAAVEARQATERGREPPARPAVRRADERTGPRPAVRARPAAARTEPVRRVAPVRPQPARAPARTEAEPAAAVTARPAAPARPATAPSPAPARAPSPTAAVGSEAEARRPESSPPAAKPARPAVAKAPAASPAARPARPPAARPVDVEPPPPPAEAMQADVAPDDDDSEPISPAVGTRIELPKGSRRLPGGMAARMKGAPAGAGGGPEATAEPEPDLPADAPPPPAPTPSAAAAPEATGATETRAKGGRRVVRNEDGVIVAAASQRSEPKIIGFIPLAQTRKRPQQVIITDASDEDKRGRASQRKQREERAQAQGRRRKMTRRGARGSGPTTPKVSTVEMSEEKKRIRVDEAIQVNELAHGMGQKASVVLRALWAMGMRGITINNAIDHETAELVAAEFGYTVENVAFQEEEITGIAPEGNGAPRAPVVTMMGHVDHGKTSLLDHIRATRVASGEAGGITQHIGAYKVDTKKGPVVFLDTPGHEAFTAMRARGTQVTDLVVLVVAADDGVMPTTIEAIKHAKDAATPVVVAINKVDKPEANPGRVKQALMEQGIVGEEFGGDTSIVEVSAKTGQGVEELLETLGLQTEILELRTPPEGRAQGVVLEARIDKGRGTVATVLVQSGTLCKGDTLVANEYSGKVRGLYDHRGKKLKEAGPSTPVEVLGLSGVPAAGDPVNVVDNERDAKALVSHRREQRKRKESVRSGPSIHELLQRKKTPVLKIVLRADVQGSAQALEEALVGLATDKVKVEVIKAEVGQINETDVKYARAGDAAVFGFNVKTTGKAAPVADAEGVPIYTFGVIYDATDKAKELMVSMLEPEYREKPQGEAEVRALFPIPRLGVVAGCRVVKGVIQRSSHIRVVRDGEVLHEGTIGSLRVFKDDVREVKDGFECGIVVDGYASVQEGDTIQAFEVEAIPPSL